MNVSVETETALAGETGENTGSQETERRWGVFTSICLSACSLFPFFLDHGSGVGVSRPQIKWNSLGLIFPSCVFPAFVSHPSSPWSDLPGSYSSTLVPLLVPGQTSSTLLLTEGKPPDYPGVSSTESSWAMGLVLTPSPRCKGCVAAIPSIPFSMVPTTPVPSPP